MATLLHGLNKAGDSVSTYGSFVFNQGATPVNDLPWGFGDGYEPNVRCVSTTTFVAICFHLMQQCGGKLYHKHKRVRALRMEDTGGYDLSKDTEIEYDGKIIPLHVLCSEEAKEDI